MNTIYIGKNILSMENNTIDAIFIKDGIIYKTGNIKDVLPFKNDRTEIIYLNEKCLLPSFIDSHGHIVSFAKTFMFANLSTASSFDEILSILNNFKQNHKIHDNEALVGFGYDHNILKENKHPTKDLLDKVDRNIPILITHASGHMGVVNSKALEILNITSNTTKIEGGKIGIQENSNIPNGYLEENALLSNINKIIKIPKTKLIKAIKKAQKEYLKYGITTSQEGYTKDEEFSILKYMSKKNLLDIDIVSYVDIKNSDYILKNNKEYLNYKNNYRLGGYKLFLDGSPQSKTAWLSSPYKNEDTYCGYPIYSDEEVYCYVLKSLNENIQLITHCNGDKAASQLISAFKKTNQKITTRPVMIHSQLVTPTQLKEMNKINMIASFFVDHIYLWGDIHIKNLGKRAYNISPIKSAIKNNIIYTMHEDTPVTNPNILNSIWVSTKRQTKNGITLNSDEKISIYEALKAVTKNAAYSYFEENTKGSLKEGKKADLIILDKNPLKIKNLDELKNIKILETIKEGKTLYKLKEK